MSEQQWKLVPVEPTEEMRAEICSGISHEHMVRNYKLMLAAAPQPPALGGEPEPFGLIYRDGSSAIIQLVGDPHIKDGMPVYGENEVARLQAEVEVSQFRAELLLDQRNASDDNVGKLQAEVERLREDAARYRFLRDGGNVKIEGVEMVIDVVCNRPNALCWDGSECIGEDDLDSAIDAALAEGAKS